MNAYDVLFLSDMSVIIRLQTSQNLIINLFQAAYSRMNIHFDTHVVILSKHTQTVNFKKQFLPQKYYYKCHFYQESNIEPCKLDVEM